MITEQIEKDQLRVWWGGVSECFGAKRSLPEWRQGWEILGDTEGAGWGGVGLIPPSSPSHPTAASSQSR